jgi:hypothetical protein
MPRATERIEGQSVVGEKYKVPPRTVGPQVGRWLGDSFASLGRDRVSGDDGSSKSDLLKGLQETAEGVQSRQGIVRRLMVDEIGDYEDYRRSLVLGRSGSMVIAKNARIVFRCWVKGDTAVPC